MPAGTLRVLQLNAGSLMEPGWADRRWEIVAWLEHLEPDVVCLQEIWEDEHHENTASWIVGQLPSDGWHWHFGGCSFGPRVRDEPTLRFGSAVLSRWPIESAAYHALPVAEGDDDPFVVDVPWELVHVHTAGLDVFSCHLAAAPRQAAHRRLQVLAIDRLVTAARGDLDTLPEPGHTREAMPAVVCGDCNAEPDSDEIRYLCGLTTLDGHTAFYQDAWRVAGEGPGYTQDWRTHPLTASANVHRKRIDYVFVGDPFQRRGGAGRVLSARLALHESLTGTLASDHSGVVVEIVWPDRPS